MNREQVLRRRICALTWLFIIGLALSGVTALPLRQELDWLAKTSGARDLVNASPSTAPPARALWLAKVEAAVDDTALRHPFLFYGTDWLAFGHFVIAIAFIGALRDPCRNRWLFTFGIIACLLVVPYAFVFGALRGIPIWWRCIDCSFGVFGLIPLCLCKRWLKDLDTAQAP